MTAGERMWLLRSIWPNIFLALAWEIFYDVPWASVTSQLNKTLAIPRCLCVYVIVKYFMLSCTFLYEYTHTSSCANTLLSTTSRSSQDQIILKFNHRRINETVIRSARSNFCLSRYVTHLDATMPWFTLTIFNERAGQNAMSSRQRSCPASQPEVWWRLRCNISYPHSCHCNKLSSLNCISIAHPKAH